MSHEGRLHHLDSLRGIAAMAVSLDHCLFSFRDVPYHGFFSALLAGAPVNFFFVLSGFVLSRSLDRTGALTVGGAASFCVRRLFRLYPAILAVLLFTAVTARFYHIPTEAIPASNFIRRVISEAHSDVNTLAEYGRSLLLLNIKFDPLLWTIRVEVLGSFVLPILLLATRRHSGVVVPMLVGFALFKTFAAGDPSNLLAFYLGLLVHYSTRELKALSAAATKLSIVAGVLALLFGSSATLDPVTENIIIAGLLAVLVPCNWPALRRFLEQKPLLFFGKISYSFYLLHLPVLMLTWSILIKTCPWILGRPSAIVSALILFVVTAAPTVILAAWSHRFVEVPSNNFGHILAKNIGRRLAAPSKV